MWGWACWWVPHLEGCNNFNVNTVPRSLQLSFGVNQWLLTNHWYKAFAVHALGCLRKCLQLWFCFCLRARSLIQALLSSCCVQRCLWRLLVAEDFFFFFLFFFFSTTTAPLGSTYHAKRIPMIHLLFPGDLGTWCVVLWGIPRVVQLPWGLVLDVGPELRWEGGGGTC